MKGTVRKLHERAPAGAGVLLAMSGGVDSAVSAARLVEAGYRVVGVTMKNYCYGDRDVPERSCCSLEAIDDARAVCDRLDIRHTVVSTEDVFGREVYDNFLSEYRAGRTPNPCVRCNSIVRFDTLRDLAARMDVEFVATGHYARVFESEAGRRYVARASDGAKDQSYFLSGLAHDDLDRVLFPLGESTKPDVRRAARAAGLEVADKPESQEVCFIPDGTLHEFLEKNGIAMTPGPVETTAGAAIGRHAGLASYTVGQRRGLGVATGRPQYVVRLDLDRNAVVIGDDADLLRASLVCRLNWIDGDALAAAGDRLQAQIRSRHRAQPVASVTVDGDRGRVRFHRPQRAVAPGQTVAFYDGDVVVGSGVIESERP